MKIHFNPKPSLTKSIFTLAVAVALALPSVASVNASGNNQPVAASAYFTVNTTFDEVDSAPGDGKCQTSTGACTLRAAIQETNKLLGSDTISVPAGTYKLTVLGADEDKSKSGDLDITDNLSIKGSGSGTKGTVIDGQASDRIFDIIGVSTTVDISGVTIRKGKVKGSGGGVRNSGSLRLDDSLVQFSSASEQGGAGGGILSTGNLSLTRTTVSNNSAAYTGGGIITTGGTLALGTMTLTNAIVSNNTSASTGGGINMGGIVTIINTTISGNIAGGPGGGIGMGGGGQLAIESSTISGNTSAAGGGIYAYEVLILNNTTLSGNNAELKGGGIYYLGYGNAYAKLTNTTIANNKVSDTTVGQGGGVFFEGGPLTLNNTLIALNTGGYKAPDCGFQGVQLTSNGHNLIGSTADCNYPSGTGDLRDLDPSLGPLRNNGGPTFTHLLLGNSRAVDAGSNQICTGTDQTGFARPFDGNSDGSRICDIGAFEFRIQ